MYRSSKHELFSYDAEATSLVFESISIGLSTNYLPLQPIPKFNMNKDFKGPKKKYILDHKVLTKNIALVLRDVIKEGTNLDKALEKVMKANKKWNFRNRTYIYETCSDMIRYWRLIATAADTDKHFTENQFYRIYASWFVYRDKELPNLPAFKDINTDIIEQRLRKYQKITKIRESYPDWMDELCRQQLGASWDKMAIALNQEPKMVLRANTLKTTVNQLQELLNSHHIDNAPIPWSPYAVELVFRRNVFRLPEFKDGFFEVQDSASQMVADFLQVKPGMRVIDACAGTGGKSLHIAALMQNKGRLIALDNKAFKLEELRKRARRAGVSIIETKEIESTKTTKRLAETADRLLLDLPCSGLGVLRRNPDAKWKLQAHEINNLIEQQREIMERFAPTLKSGGKMVYATCSILPMEGEEQIKWFMQKHGEQWIFEGEKRYAPTQFDADGFYMALLTKK
ncbi:MAG TPA: methyltransferase domain-containing protein [Bacteroidia bacterium]|nr:methyltransferase domain-containing protein [Bacteroidia bacterium]